MSSPPEIDDLPRFEFLDAEFARLLEEAERSGRRHRLAGFGIASALAAVLVVVAVAVLGGPTGNDTVGPPTAQAALHRFASETAEDDSLIAGPGQFLYQRALIDTTFRSYLRAGEAVTNDGPDTSRALIQEDWADSDGNHTFTVSMDGKPLMEGIAGEGSFQNKSGVVTPNGPFGGPLNLTYEDLLALPRDPVALLDRVKELGQPTDTGAVEALATLLDIPLPADLQASLLDAAALIPGAELDEGVEAPTGETLTAVSYDRGETGDVFELLFDSESGTYRGHAVVEDGTRRFESLVLERGVVDAVGEKPSS